MDPGDNHSPHTPVAVRSLLPPNQPWGCIVLWGGGGISRLDYVTIGQTVKATDDFKKRALILLAPCTPP
jgi:hypothetical protein